MSQSSTLGGDRSGTDAAKATSAGRAVLILAFAAFVGIFLLQQLDDAPSLTQAAQTTQTQAVQQAPVTAPVVPTTLAIQTRPPSEVKVLVANGIGVTGVASKVAGRLQPIGYQLLKPGNTVRSETNSLVHFTAGFAAEAAAVANSLGLPASAVQPMPVPALVTDMQNANVVVVVGNELANNPLTLSAQPQNGNIAGETTTGTQTGQTTVATTAVNPLNGPLSQMPGATSNQQVPAANSGANVNTNTNTNAAR